MMGSETGLVLRNDAVELQRTHFAHVWLENQVIAPLVDRRRMWRSMHGQGRYPEMLEQFHGEALRFVGYCIQLECTYSPEQVVDEVFAALSLGLRSRLKQAVARAYRASAFVTCVIPTIQAVAWRLVAVGEECRRAWGALSFEAVEAKLDDLLMIARDSARMLHADVPRGIPL